MNISYLSHTTGLKAGAINNIIALMDEGASIPFIARYRKDMTGGATDEALRAFDKAYQMHLKVLKRQSEIIKRLSERELLTDALESEIKEAHTLAFLEDIYLPYKGKKSTRAQTALDAGLASLADKVQSMGYPVDRLTKEAKAFLSEHFSTAEKALKGACDIIAERFSENAKERAYIRHQLAEYGRMTVKAKKSCDQEGPFFQFDGLNALIKTIPLHRLMAIFRGEKSKALRISLEINDVYYQSHIDNTYFRFKKGSQEAKALLMEAYLDGFKRLLFPSIEREILSEFKSKCQESASDVFARNLKELLMTRPVKTNAVLGVDPGFKTGAKLAVIDKHGYYIDSAVIYPAPPHNKVHEAEKIVNRLLSQYPIDTIAIGNGTASSELQAFFSKLNKSNKEKVRFTVVSEAGASVYSASKLAAQEYPSLDVTVRGAISIASRLQNPMAEYVKIDPKSLGIGQYQHDVDQSMLERKLHDVTEAVVNKVGVDLNTASAKLLSYISGIGPKLAEEIVHYRQRKGEFDSIFTLKKVKGLGSKSFEQCAGFMRIISGKNMLDNTGVHPDHYSFANALLKSDSLTKDRVVILAKEYDIGVKTAEDIIQELEKPGLDPRDQLDAIPFSVTSTDIENLKEGEYLSGVVRNITDFGVFVDIGLKQDGMIHISELSQRRLSHPSEIVHINQSLSRLKVIAVDIKKQRVSLSLKQ